MKRLIQLLAVSAGSGIVVGAGIRWVERQRQDSDANSAGPIASPPQIDRAAMDRLAERITAIEQRFDAQASVDAGRYSGAQHDPKRPRAIAEERLEQEFVRRAEGGIEALSKSIQERFESRLAPLEAELSVQRASVAELREYSLRTKRSLQKLVEGVDKLLSAQTSRSERDGGSVTDQDEVSVRY